MYSDETYILRALKAGARGYLLKDSAETDLVRAIHSVAEGKSFFSPTVSRVLLDDYVQKLKRTGGENSYDSSPPANAKSSNSSPKANPTKKSPISSISASTPSKPTAATSWKN